MNNNKIIKELDEKFIVKNKDYGDAYFVVCERTKFIKWLDKALSQAVEEGKREGARQELERQEGKQEILDMAIKDYYERIKSLENNDE